MRVAFVFNNSHFLGGGEVSLAELIKAIDEKLIEPFVMVPGSGEIESLLQKSGANVVPNPFPPVKTPFLNFFLSSLIHFAKKLKNLKIELIHANGSRVCLYSVLAGRMLGIPVLWHVRETIKDLFFYDAFLFALSRAVVCVSESVKTKRFGSFSNQWKTKIHVVHNGVDSSVFYRDTSVREKVRKELGIKENEILFGVVANYNPIKGQDFFLNGAAALKNSNPALPFRVLLIGRPLDIAFYHRLRNLSAEIQLEDKVLFRGHTDRIAEIYSALDIFVLPSKREGFSRSLLEAMSAGLPVLATQLSEIQEAVDDGVNGFLVKQGDVQGLAQAARALASDRGLCEGMGALNRKKVEEKFSLLSHARAMETVYSRILGGPGCRTR